jgi:hypothetical protein
MRHPQSIDTPQKIKLSGITKNGVSFACLMPFRSPA